MKKSRKVIQYCVMCLDCKDIIHSRAQHDFHSCTCGKVSIDGGWEYVKAVYEDKEPLSVRLQWHLGEKITPELFRQHLYIDWNNGFNRYGIIKPDFELLMRKAVLGEKLLILNFEVENLLNLDKIAWVGQRKKPCEKRQQKNGLSKRRSYARKDS